MRRENFGKLIKTLRRERIDLASDNLYWTQEKLAEETGLSKNVISKLERGKKVNLYEDHLIALADAFHLSTGERREFINAANGVDTKFMVADQNTPESVYEHCVQVMQTIQSPAILVDPFYDLIAVNTATIYLFNLQDSDYLIWKDRPYPPNILSVLLNPDSQMIPIVGRSYREFRLRNVMNYRIRTLPHRYKPYFKNQLKRFHKTLPEFGSLWLETQQRMNEDFFMGLPIITATESWGTLKVMGSSMVFPTEFGNLELIVENPADDSTREVLAKLVDEVGLEFVQLYDWLAKGGHTH